MPSNSEIILTAQTHPEDSSEQTATGDKAKGDGYYSRADGLHTVQYNLNKFIGTITMQASLASIPGDRDWVDITSITETSTTGSKVQNFTGNYVWVRAVVSNWTGGTVNSITLNH